MVTDNQVRRLKKMLSQGKNLNESALKTGMDEKTARKYHKLGKLPSELQKEHTWQTRQDPFAEDWEAIKGLLESAPTLKAITVFQDLQQKYPGKYQDGQLRTLQRKIKRWRALAGPPKEVMFTQEHHPGILSQSDFTHMTSLGITINKEMFPHLLYHFVMTKSNWETGSICFSECFESLSYGLQEALWELGGVPVYHQTDCLTTAVNMNGNPEEFTKRYLELMHHYELTPKRINPYKAHENGDVEQSHFRLKDAVEQQLLLRGSKDFSSREEYAAFLKKIFNQRNKGRAKNIAIEKEVLRPLPSKKLDIFKRLEVTVSRASTILVQHNIYSVNSQLIGEKVKVKVFAEYLEVWYAEQMVEQLPRLRGSGKHQIQYRHIIASLIRKPGAFENYKYKNDMFPSTIFRMAYDGFMKNKTARSAAKEYLAILNLAAQESEELVGLALERLLHQEEPLDYKSLKAQFEQLKEAKQPERLEVQVQEVDLNLYDFLLKAKEQVWTTTNN